MICIQRWLTRAMNFLVSTVCTYSILLISIGESNAQCQGNISKVKRVSLPYTPYSQGDPSRIDQQRDNLIGACRGYIVTGRW